MKAAAAMTMIILFWTLWMQFVMWIAWLLRGKPRILPHHLSHRPHEDFAVWPFNRIPREATAFLWGPPRRLWGNQTNYVNVYENGVVPHAVAPKPIPEPGTWQVSCYPDLGPVLGRIPAYIAFTTKSGFHFRDGVRWDDVDRYCQWPSIAIKRGVK